MTAKLQWKKYLTREYTFLYISYAIDCYKIMQKLVSTTPEYDISHGQKELVTGKRHRAHCGKDPGEWDDYGLYYFKWNGESFTKQIIDYGPIGETKGTGIFFDIADLRGTGRKDIIAPGKDGLYIFYNESNS